ncbi:hypothetical protein ACFQVA_40315 [Actinomadura keratinilytica]
MTRSFFYWPDFHPEPFRIDEELCDRFRDFLDAHTEAGMGTVPTFIVGHMSGENWDPVWRGGRDLYEDVWLVGRQAWFVSQMTRRFKDHPAVTGWLITNEMPGYGRVYQENPPSSDVVTAWAQFMCDAVRAAGGTQPVSLGDGAWGIEVTGRDNGSRSATRPSTSISSARTSTARTPTGPASTTARPSSANSPPSPVSRSSWRSSACPPTPSPRPTPASSTGRPCTTPCSGVPPAGSPGTTPTTTPCGTARPTTTTPSRCTSASPTAKDAPRSHCGNSPISPPCWSASISPAAGAPTRTPPWWSPLSWNAATPTAAPPTVR